MMVVLQAQNHEFEARIYEAQEWILEPFRNVIRNLMLVFLKGSFCLATRACLWYASYRHGIRVRVEYYKVLVLVLLTRGRGDTLLYV